MKPLSDQRTSNDPRDCECDVIDHCTFHGKLGPVGPGTPEARMRATWDRMHEDEADLDRLVGYSPLESMRTIEWAYVDAFRALRAEHKRMLSALMAIAALEIDPVTGEPQEPSGRRAVDIAKRVAFDDKEAGR